MKTAKKTEKTKASKTGGEKTKTKGKGKDKSAAKKADRAKEREAKKEARKGDGSFPDLIVITKEKDKDGKSYFAAHNGEDMETLYKNDQTVGVYKLRRVSKVVISRKVAR